MHLPTCSRPLALVLLLGALVATTLPQATPATGAPAAPVSTTVGPLVRAEASATGSLGMVGLTAAHEVSAPVGPGARLGGARIDRDANAAALAGAWGQGGELGAWLGPPSTTPVAQFRPTATLVDSIYVEDQLGDDAVPLHPGDRGELALAVLPQDTSQPWGRQRGATGGRPGWDRSVVTSTITADFGGQTGTLDVVQFRADVVVRGGDLDARRQVVDVEPLTIPLGRTYGDAIRFIGLAGASGTPTTYLNDFSLAVAPAAGTAVLRARLTGYVPQATTRTLPNGATVKEWHLPITGVIAIDAGGTGLVPQVGTRLPEAGRVLAVSPAGTRRQTVPAGTLLSATPTPSGPATRSAGGETAAPAEDGDTTSQSDVVTSMALSQVSEGPMDAAARVAVGMTGPVTLDVPTAGLTATLDPDLRGQGVLGLRDVRSTWLAASYATEATVAAVEVDGVTHRLDRTNLVDLRALPVSAGGGVRVSLLTSGEGLPPAVTSATRSPGEGLLVDAVHDLGEETYAFVTHQVFNGGVPAGGRLNTVVSIRSLRAAPVAARAAFDVELDQPGPARQGSTPIEVETTTSSGTSIAVGEHRVDGIHRDGRGLRGGRATVLQAPAPLGGRAPDPSRTLVGQPVAVSMTPPTTPPSVEPSQTATFRAGLSEPLRFGPPLPPPLGGRCGPEQVVDVSAPDGAPSGDILAAWFDDDPGTVYATIQLREVPTTPSTATGDLYALHWRERHVLQVARALLQPDGTWRFQIGSLGFFADTTGEVLPGPRGLIRIAVPRQAFDLREGAVLRDVAAHSFVGTTTLRRDHAPKGSTPEFGLGPDVPVGTCAPAGVALSVSGPTSALTGEAVRLEAVARDGAGQPVPGLLVDLGLGDQTVTARTGVDGRASATVQVTALPGTRTARGDFGGGNGYATAAGTQAVEVLARPTRLTGFVEGNGINTVLVATLVDVTSAGGLAGRTVRFTAEGLPIGIATTDASGVARLRADGVPRGGRTYAAAFGGDDRHAPAAATIGR